MGEYYNWINIDKKEYISPGDFNCGIKFHASMYRDSIPLHALHSLMINEWKGDHIIWFGDECLVPEHSQYSVIHSLYEQSAEFGYPGYAFDMICESYRNVSCLFKEAEKEVREEIGHYLDEYRETGRLDQYNEYGIDLNAPYEGLFQKTGRRYPFTINYSKKIYYTLSETVILFNDHTKIDSVDPLPILMNFGSIHKPGEWLGDIIGVSDQRPEGYSLIRKISLDW